MKRGYRDLLGSLSRSIPRERLITDEVRRFAFGTDASFYRLVPELVVIAEGEEEVRSVLRECRERKIPVTFRAAGTSLSGQAISDSVLLVLGKSWNGYEIADDGAWIRLQPGVIGAHANRYLAPLQKKIGPDPASINAAMVGGIAANNASGMCCGTAQNSYRTLKSIRVVFPDGTVLDTKDPDSVGEFRERRGDFLERISDLSRRVKENGELAARIRKKYMMKNTTGYSLNALVDFDDPVEIVEHLMVGSEGTLAFISEVVYHTVPDHPFKATSLMLFPDVETACRAVQILRSCPVDAAEIMDRASLRSVEGKEGMPDYLSDLGKDVAALLVETRSPTPEGLRENVNAIRDSLRRIPTVMPLEFTEDPEEYEKLWNIRKGLFPSVGAVREAGTTVIIEDIAFPIPHLAAATVELMELFKKHGYHDAIIFGHALEGNLHFVFSQDFNIPEEVERYARFLDEMARMVVERYDGSLKAEHGTGRNMAPFVELEWGKEAVSLMKEIKEAFDPEGILNPGVIINEDPSCHVKAIKPLPKAHDLIDRCIECGFCEVRCPSRHLTTTPRQRITLFREISRSAEGDRERERKFARAFRYLGDETCAADGLCSLSCPVGINTGDLVKLYRSWNRGKVAKAVASGLARRMDLTTGLARGGLSIGGLLLQSAGGDRVEKLVRKFRSMTGAKVPLLGEWLPGPARFPRQSGKGRGRKVVYFPSCVARTFGGHRGEGISGSLPVLAHSLLEKAGFEVVFPKGVSRLCCGLAFESKGFIEEGERLLRELESALLEVSSGGELPILFDTSPCFLRVKEKGRRDLPLYDPIEFSLQFLLPGLEVSARKGVVAVHPTCSTIRAGLQGRLIQLASHFAERVVVPDHVECCAFAGDRGFTHPELNESALFFLKEGIPEECSEGYSTSRTCEIGLTRISGIPYRSIFALVDECTAPKGGKI